MPFTPLPKCAGTINFAAPKSECRPPRTAHSRTKPHFPCHFFGRSSAYDRIGRIEISEFRHDRCVNELRTYQVNASVSDNFYAQKCLSRTGNFWRTCCASTTPSMRMGNPFASSWSYYTLTWQATQSLRLEFASKWGVNEMPALVHEVSHLFHSNLYTFAETFTLHVMHFIFQLFQ